MQHTKVSPGQHVLDCQRAHYGTVKRVYKDCYGKWTVILEDSKGERWATLRSNLQTTEATGERVTA